MSSQYWVHAVVMTAKPKKTKRGSLVRGRQNQKPGPPAKLMEARTLSATDNHVCRVLTIYLTIDLVSQPMQVNASKQILSLS